MFSPGLKRITLLSNISPLSARNQAFATRACSGLAVIRHEVHRVEVGSIPRLDNSPYSLDTSSLIDATVECSEG